MNEQLRAFMAKASPKTCKTVIDKARYGNLPDKLTVGEIASLWSEDGMVSGSSEWKAAIEFLLDLIRSGKLVCENIDVALGKPDPQKEQYERIVSGLGYASIVSVDVNYNPTDALVSKESFMCFLSGAGGLSIIDRLLVNKWFQGSREQDIEINPLHAGSKRNLERDKLALIFVKENPGLLMEIPADIKKSLQSFNGVFSSGYPDWWGTQIIFPRTSIGGRPKKR